MHMIISLKLHRHLIALLIYGGVGGFLTTRGDLHHLFFTCRQDGRLNFLQICMKYTQKKHDEMILQPCDYSEILISSLLLQISLPTIIYIKGLQ